MTFLALSYQMITYEDKADLLAQKIMAHIAREGLSKLSNFSHLAKAIGKGRSLLYFYFKNEDEILDALYKQYVFEINYHFDHVRSQKFGFIDYVHYLVEIKDLYFFTINCAKIVEHRPELTRFIEHGLSTLDAYCFEQFVAHYHLDQHPPSNVSFVFSCFRSLWWERSGPYESWTNEKVSTMVDDIDVFIEESMNVT